VMVAAKITLLQTYAWEPVCPIVSDGRVPPIIDIAAFDRHETPFEGRRPRDVSWSAILDFPRVVPSLFDADYGGKAIEIGKNELSDLSPGDMGAQKGLRWSSLYFAENADGNDTSTRGVKTFHWSVRQGRPLNLSHEYLNVFHERKDGHGYQFALTLGTLVGREKQTNKKNWKMLNRNNEVVFQTPMLTNEWENFAVTLDWERNTMKVWYSKTEEPLQAVTKELPNNNDNWGRFEIGVMKKSTGAKDMWRDGFHESNIHESQIYGGIFIEDSSNGCFSG